MNKCHLINLYDRVKVSYKFFNFLINSVKLKKSKTNNHFNW